MIDQLSHDFSINVISFYISYTEQQRCLLLILSKKLYVYIVLISYLVFTTLSFTVTHIMRLGVINFDD